MAAPGDNLAPLWLQARLRAAPRTAPQPARASVVRNGAR